MSQPTTVLACQNLSKIYDQGDLRVEVLKNIEFNVVAGEMVAVVGSSGSGKSTLLNLLGGLDTPTSGTVLLGEQDIYQLNDNARGRLRNSNMGFVYQFHHLLAEFDALENVCMPLWIGEMDKTMAEEKARAMLDKVGLAQRIKHKPAELSGGERQRVAIARALVTEPKVVLMDEPTGNLDKHSARGIHDLMASLNASLATSFVVVTHDEQFAQQLSRVVVLEDGQLKESQLA
ncbi:lipoprotein-releasing ABC transporter ATP-binding protein LolD [Aurantivibrio plasticivorans]